MKLDKEGDSGVVIAMVVDCGNGIMANNVINRILDGSECCHYHHIGTKWW